MYIFYMCLFICMYILRGQAYPEGIQKYCLKNVEMKLGNLNLPFTLSLLWARSWTRWPSGISSNLIFSMVLWSNRVLMKKKNVHRRYWVPVFPCFFLETRSDPMVITILKCSDPKTLICSRDIAVAECTSFTSGKSRK